MKKAGWTIALTVALIVAYLILTAVHPAIVDIVVSSNASTNWTNFEMTQHTIEALPLYVWFIPFLLYLIAIVVVLKADDSTI
jgi:type II secretory pathway component PulF